VDDLKAEDRRQKKNATPRSREFIPGFKKFSFTSKVPPEFADKYNVRR